MAPGALVGIIQKKELWATHFRHLNDRGELTAGETIIEEEARRLLETQSKPAHHILVNNFLFLHKRMPLSTTAPIFVASLSESCDQLSQWRGYGNRAAGYQIGFSDFLLPTSEPDGHNPDAAKWLYLVKCIYDEENYRARVRQEIVEVARGFERLLERVKKQEHADPFTMTATSIAMRRIAALVPRYKVEGFKEEQEWRIVCGVMRGHESKIEFRNTGSTVVPFIRIPLCEDGGALALTEVRFGPTVDPDSGKNGARMLLELNGYNPDLVVPSKIPFRGP